MFSDATAGFSFGNLLNLGSILRILFTVVVGMIMMKIVMGIVDRTLAKSGSGNVALGKYLRSVIKVVLWILLILTVAGSMGINVTSLIALFSVAGLAVSLALQNTLANLAGGVMLLVTKPFEVGDYIESNGVGGTVTDIAIFYTTLTTPDNKKIVVPNGALSNSVVVNYSANDTRRLDLTFSISYNTDLDLAKKVLLSCAKLDERIFSDPAPVVYITEHADSAVMIQLRVWLRKENYWDVNFAMIEQVKRSFDQLGVEIPFPQMDVHLIK
jgi:small conductance mechanosensitive channel